MRGATLRVGWLADDGSYVGGAELTEQQFAADAPRGVEVVRLKPPDAFGYSNDWKRIDVFVVHNCVSFDATVLPFFRNRVVLKYVHDCWPHGDRKLRNWLLDNACLLFTSPLHIERFPYVVGSQPMVCPPAIPLQRFRDANQPPLPDRPQRQQRALYLAHHAKGLEPAMDWADANDMPLDVFGLNIANTHAIDYDDVPALMARYSHFVHLPRDVEPFGRTVVEAWAAGCVPVVNDNVGAKWFIENRPDLLAPGAASLLFWKAVTTAVVA